jgi:hypothetical protein
LASVGRSVGRSVVALAGEVRLTGWVRVAKGKRMRMDEEKEELSASQEDVRGVDEDDDDGRVQV